MLKISHLLFAFIISAVTGALISPASYIVADSASIEGEAM
jgi:hypothetical protein